MPSGSNEQILSPATSFIGLQSYTEAQADSFFGRDAEIDALTQLIRLNSLTIVFGKSGTGKTSLLNAGVFPLLRKNYCLPFRLRLEFNDDSPDLVTQIKKVLKKEIDAYGFKVDSYPSSETLWEYFHKESLWKTVTPILVFDQFEEIFTLAKKNPKFGKEELERFWEELSDLAENSIPQKLRETFLTNKEKISYNYKKQKVKMVFAFREEYLPEFESITSKIPSIKTSRFRLMPMNGHQAYDVITKTWKENIGRAEAKTIVSYLTKEPNQEIYDLITVEPSLLSQVCAYIDEKRIEEGSTKISTDLLNKYKQKTILRSIYLEAVTAAETALLVANGPDKKPKVEQVSRFLEDNLITTKGFRTKYNLSEKDNYIMPGLEVLQSKYFIREDDNVIELTHDVLAPIINEDREKRAKRFAVAAQLRKALKWFIIILLLAGLSAFFINYSVKKEADDYYNKIIEKAKADSLKIMQGILGNPAEPNNDTNINDLQKRIKDLINDTIALNNKIRKLESDNSILISENLSLKDSLAKKIAEIKILKRDTAILAGTIRINNIIITNKTREYLLLKKEYDDLKIRYDKLLDAYNKLVAEKNQERIDTAKIIRDIQFPPSPCPVIDTLNSVQLAIYYTRHQKYFPSIEPEKINIYLIPYLNENMKTIKNAKVYDYYNFNEPALDSAVNRKKAQYCNGTYYFSNVTPGKFLVKVCTLYGAYKEVTIKSGKERLVLDAVPPVR